MLVLFFTAACLTQDSSWMMLLMVEDEFGRAESSKFRKVAIN
jgi:hypothetical protein